MRIQRAVDSDREALVGLWERSVRATHAFLSDGDILALRPQVAGVLASDRIEWWVARFGQAGPVGFLGRSSGTIEALSVDVNEQNPGAVRFYEALGFAITGRSPTDGHGRPFPLLHMSRPGPPTEPPGRPL